MTDAERLDALYAQVPSFNCIPGCHECCGLIPFAPAEWDRVADKREATSSTCPYVCPEGCAIYEQRPFMCRLFGTAAPLLCPRSCGPAEMLSVKEANALMNEYRELVGDCTEFYRRAVELLLKGE